MPRNALEKFQKIVLDGLDCPCSALALNCLQFGCCITHLPVASFDMDQNADWMQHLCKSNPDTKLRSLVIPGTHDSATPTISKFQPFSASGLTQNLSILEQLNRGIRYLDLRLAGGGGTISVFHGCLQGGPLADICQEICAFMEEHPGEFLFIEMVSEYGQAFSPAEKLTALDMLHESLGPYLCKETDPSVFWNQKTMQELTASNQRVCIFVHNRIYEGFEAADSGVTYDRAYIKDNYNFFDSGQFMHNRWHNTRENDQLLQWNLDEVHRNGPDRNRLLVNQFVLTPGVGGAKDILNLLVGMSSLRPVSFASRLAQPMDEFLRANATESWNVIMMDYVDLVPGLISFLIGLNFVGSLEIIKATIVGEDLDVTDKIQSFVQRAKVLYLTNVATDLGLDVLEGQLKVEYNIKDKQASTLTVDFDDDTEVVLSEYDLYVRE